MALGILHNAKVLAVRQTERMGNLMLHELEKLGRAVDSKIGEHRIVPAKGIAHSEDTIIGISVKRCTDIYRCERHGIIAPAPQRGEKIVDSYGAIAVIWRVIGALGQRHHTIVATPRIVVAERIDECPALAVGKRGQHEHMDYRVARRRRSEGTMARRSS